jgi:hypothetical protein
VSLQPTCVAGHTDCAGRLDSLLVGNECKQTPAVCHVESMKELEGTACSPDVGFCPFGRGCSSCRCDCQESTRLWHCECTAC